MEPLRVMTAAEQVAEYLRRALGRGEWGGRIPGGNQLAGLLGVGRNTVEAALQMLENQGVLAGQGAGKRRRVVLGECMKSAPTLRVAILPGVVEDRRVDYVVELQHELVEAGHVAFFTEKSLNELAMDVNRIARMVKRTEADAWVVVGSSRAVLEWFVGYGVPAFALFGRRRDLTIAGVGPDKASAFREVVRRLVELGHRRIVLLALAARRLPEPGLPERAFLAELAAHGIGTGPFNLPDWEESPEGLHHLLDSLFQVTPPTALLIDEAYLFHAVKHHLSERGIRIPGDVSLVCTDPDRTFDWCRPSIAQIHWDSSPLVRRIILWAENVARGGKDLRQTLTPARFIEGGTIGKANRDGSETGDPHEKM
jgi:DNA-binding LacI/PurR family transcriptional regulator